MLIGLILAVVGLNLAVVGLVATGKSYASGSTGTVTAPTAPAGPYADGQTITVSGTGFSTRASGNTMEIIECADPDGTVANLPQDNSSCDGTTQNSNTIVPATDGSFTDQYPITELDTVVSGGGYESNINCNATNYCVLWIGEDDVGNFTGTTAQPVAFSPPFLINPAPTTEPTTLTTTLSGGGQSGTTISVPTDTAVTDTAHLTGTNAANAGGSVTYSVYSDSACTVAAGSGGTVNVTDGSVPASNPVALSGAGTYYWQASYSGDTTNAKSTSTCGTDGEIETVTAAPPTTAPTTLTTTLSGGGQSGTTISVPTDTAVTDTAHLTGTNAANAGGSVTYSVYSDSACTVAAGSGGTVNVTDGSVPASNPVALSGAGTYYWQASYSGDTTNAKSTSTCGTDGEIETVTTTTPPPPASTSVSTTLYGGGQSGTTISVPAGTSVTDTAHLSGANAASAGGTVTYSVYSDSACTVSAGSGGTVNVTDGSVAASTAVTLSTAGTYYWQASYSGDPANTMSKSTCGAEGEVETITTPTTTVQPTSLATSLMGASQFGGSWLWWHGHFIAVFSGTPVADSATLNGANAAEAGGTVTYTVYSDPWHDDVVANAGTVTVTDGVVPNSDPITLPTGIYFWQAVYSGDANNGPSTSPGGSEIEIVIPAPRCSVWGLRYGSCGCFGGLNLGFVVIGGGGSNGNGYGSGGGSNGNGYGSGGGSNGGSSNGGSSNGGGSNGGSSNGGGSNGGGSNGGGSHGGGSHGGGSNRWGSHGGG
jgi:hypothetical protein